MDNTVVSRDNIVVNQINIVVSRDNTVVSQVNIVVSRDNTVVSQVNIVVSRDNTVVRRDNKVALKRYLKRLNYSSLSLSRYDNNTVYCRCYQHTLEIERVIIEKY